MSIQLQQKEYFNKIQNIELKRLLKTSYYFLSMTEEEKLDFLIWLSFIHENKEAEAEIVQSFKDEKTQVKVALEDEKLYSMTPQEEAQLEETIKRELAVIDKKEAALSGALSKAIAEGAQ